MANQIIEELVIKADQAGSLKEVKQALKDIKGAMLSAGDQGSEDFHRLAKAAAELNDRVDETNKAIAHMNPDKFNGLASAAKIGATGIELTTGAMELFGAESEDTQKALLKVQAAMQFAQGLSNIGELQKEFKALWAIVVANPLVAIATAIAAIGVGVYEIFTAYQEANSEATKLQKIAEETKKDGERQIAVMDNQLRLMTAQGASAFEIHKKEQEILDVKIRIAEASLAHKKALVQEQEETDTLWEKTQNLLGKLNPQAQAAIEKKVHDDKLARIEEAKDAEVKAQEELDALKTDALVSDAKYQAILVSQAKKANEDKVKDAKEAADELDKWNKQRLEANKEYEDQKTLDAKDGTADRMADQLKNAEIEHDRVVAEYEFKKKKALDEANLKKQLDNGALMNTASLFGSLAELSKKHMKAQKAFAVGQATINTYQAVTKAMTGVPFPFSLLAGAAALAAGLVQVRNILAVKEDGGSTGSVSTGGLSSGGADAINTPPQGIQPSARLDENGNVISQSNQPQQPQRVYVVESDITHTQNRVAVTQSQMSFH